MAKLQNVYQMLVILIKFQNLDHFFNCDQISEYQQNFGIWNKFQNFNFGGISKFLGFYFLNFPQLDISKREV